jgi:hypothetical protein
MAYEIYATLHRTQADYDAAPGPFIARSREKLHDALWDAMQVNDDRTQHVWEIIGDGGTRYDGAQVAEMIRQQRQHLKDNPPTTY